MKKTVKFGLVMLIVALFLSLVAFSASAACVSSESVNIAPQATVTGDRGPSYPIDVAEDWQGGMGDGYMFWGVWDHFHLVNDGNVNTVCPVPVHNATPVGIRLTFDGPYSLSKVVIYPYGGEGRADSSHSWEVLYGALAKQNGYEMKVTLYGGDGIQLASLSYVAGTEKIEINTADYGEISEIYIFMGEYKLAQGIWEVEAWTTETHTWEVQSVTSAPACDKEGTARVKCTECGKTTDAILPATGHSDKCLGVCANGCGMAIGINHQKDDTKPCSNACVKCNVPGTISQANGAFHVADSSNPCSNICLVCGEESVPDAYDLGNGILMASLNPSYTYAKHVANPDDPCDTTCFSCKKVEAVKAEHVPDPVNPCTVSKCSKCGLDGVFHTVTWGNIEDDFPHVRGEDGPITSVSGKYSCGIYCADCGKKGALTWGHKYDNCADRTCNICNTTVAQKERDHTFTPASPTTCTGCGYSVVPIPCEHEYDAPCDNKCNKCGQARYGWRSGYYPDEFWHVYTNACDETCNDCGAVRDPKHVFTYDCQTVCEVCDEPRTATASHTYSDVDDILHPGSKVENSVGCDESCDVCGEKRKAPHNFEKPCSTVCTTCFGKNPDADALHVYDNTCDKSCNTCGAIRAITHTFTNDCDAICNVCEFERATEPHKYDNDCDTTCNVCEFERAVGPHKYDNACDTTCNICEAVRTVGEHRYDNTCDTSCNECNASRTITHTYDNACDTDCNVCGVKRATTHSYDDGMVTKAPTEGVPGETTVTCVICGDSYIDLIPALPVTEKGMSTGAVVGIAAGSTVVAGAGGFSLFWFVIKKKSWADLIGVFKK